jgi:methionyl-tRNA synthetase
MADPFYVTTPIYYVNAVPHLGTFYTTTVADALARYHRARGHETYFLTGTDEHGQKIERMAQEMGVSPKDYCDGIVAQFKQTWERMGISYDRFIRTTDADHRAAVESMWQRLSANGDIYLADYDAMYCVGCEGWKTEEDVVIEDGNKLCPLHRRPVERVREQNYFFRLSKYADKLLALYEQPGFIRPESRKNEVTEFVKSGLRDLSISRTSVRWGIPVPNDPKHVVYVWLDALTNYVSALGGPEAVLSDPRSQALWGGCTHLIAKDILRFHAVYWPAFLLSAGLPPPKGIFCHGYITVKGQKISKSIPATRVDPNLIAATWSTARCLWRARFPTGWTRPIDRDTRPAIPCPRRSWFCATPRLRPPGPRPRRGMIFSRRAPWRRPGP